MGRKECYSCVRKEREELRDEVSVLQLAVDDYANKLSTLQHEHNIAILVSDCRKSNLQAIEQFAKDDRDLLEKAEQLNKDKTELIFEAHQRCHQLEDEVKEIRIHYRELLESAEEDIAKLKKEVKDMKDEGELVDCFRTKEQGELDELKKSYDELLKRFNESIDADHDVRVNMARMIKLARSWVSVGMISPDEVNQLVRLSDGENIVIPEEAPVERRSKRAIKKAKKN
jgi:chromosome segregation ATPase